MPKNDNFIVCPECSHEFSPGEQLSKEIEKDLRKEMQQELQSMKNDFEAQKKKLELDLKAKAKEEIKLDIEDLKQQLQEKSKKLDEANRMELELRKRARELEQKEKSFDLELQRKVDFEKNKSEEEIKRKLTEEFQLQITQRDLRLESMAKTIEELKKKSQQGSQQTQGEAFELEIERVLVAKFPQDQISEIKKGKKGADLLQIVMSKSGEEAGAILIEAKNVKNWSNDWISKAKEDQREAKAEFLVLVTEVLPPGVSRFGLVDGVWVTDFASLTSLIVALRIHALDLHQSRKVALGKGEKLDCLFQYMTENQFRQRIEGIIEGFRLLKDSLDREKTAMQRIWSQREKCLEQVILNTSEMYGEIQAIVGGALPKVEYLELEASELLAPPEGE